MPGYVSNVLLEFEHPQPSKPEHQPHRHNPPQFRVKTQLTEPIDHSKPLSKSEVLCLQQITGKFLYYSRAVDPTMNVALSALASQQTKGTKQTEQDATKFLNYCSTHPNATIRYHASDMILKLHSDASYNSEPQARSHLGGHFYMGKRDSDQDTDQGAILATTAIMQSVLSSASEAEIGALYENTKKAAILRVTLEEMGYPQPATPVQTDNSTACGIANDNIKQQRSRAIDMRFIGSEIGFARDSSISTGNLAKSTLPTTTQNTTLPRTIKRCAYCTFTWNPAPLPLATPSRQRYMFCEGVLNPHHVTAYCQGFRASRTYTPTRLPCHTPLCQHSQQRKATSDVMAVNTQANRIISLLACSYISHPFAPQQHFLVNELFKLPKVGYPSDSAILRCYGERRQ
jgi:hypothetical protein